MSQLHTECMRKVEKACKTSMYIQHMLHHLQKLGCEVSITNNKLLCEPCFIGLSGGFDPIEKEVIICENTIPDQRETNRVLLHELIHAYDVCRVKYDMKNIEHLACSEIRAASLSGDCSIWEETFKEFAIKAQKQVCVKKKALSSMLCSDQQLSKDNARAVIEKVFEYCYEDRTPFRNKSRENFSKKL